MATNQGKSNAPVERTYAYTKETIEQAIPEAATKCNYTVESIDKIGGSAKIGVGMSVASFGEWITIQISQTDSTYTKVSFSCRAKSGRENLSKNQKNIERLSQALSECLSKYPKAESTKPQVSIADELLKLKSLLDSGAISNEEYEAQKAKLLS